MKKLLLSLFAILGMGAMVHAQSVDLTASYGGYTQMDATDCHDGGPDVNNAWGVLNLGADMKVLPNLSVGASYSFSSTSRKNFSENKFYYHVVMLNGKYTYFRTPIFNLYGHLGIGSVITHQTFKGASENKGYFAYQISPLCANVSLTPKFGIFGELGFGAQGLLQVGVRYTL